MFFAPMLVLLLIPFLDSMSYLFVKSFLEVKIDQFGVLTLSISSEFEEYLIFRLFLYFWAMLSDTDTDAELYANSNRILGK